MRNIILMALSLVFFSCAHKVTHEEVLKVQQEITKELPELSDAPVIIEEKKIEKTKVVKKNKESIVKPIVEIKKDSLDIPFKEGEVLSFSAHAKGLNLGDATFSIKPFQYQGSQKLWHFVFNLETKGFIARFYSLKVTQESWNEFDTMRPVRFMSMIIENKYQKHFIDSFDYNKKIVFHKEKKEDVEKQMEIAMPSELLDSLSAFYLLRIKSDSRKSFVVYEDQVKTVEITNLGKDGADTKFSLAIQGTPTQYVWINDKKEIQKVLIQTKNGNVELRRN